MMRLAFYKGMGVGGDWKQKLIHKAIARISSPHTHVELIFSDGTSFSSEIGGPRFKDIGFTHKNRWTFVGLPHLTPPVEAHIRHRAKVLSRLAHEGLIKYDVLGAIGCTLTGNQNPWKYFCSEVVYEVLAPDIAIPSLNHKMHPERLFTVIEIVKDMQSI